MDHPLSSLYEIVQLKEAEKVLKKSDVKNTERKMEKDVTDLIDNNEISFINNFLKKGEKIDNKTIKSIDGLLAKYKKKIGPSKIKSDANILMLAPILAAMESELRK
jgi:Glu-tRNA(Gln) amidotransferase subunit E-like FAD-binding protein